MRKRDLFIIELLALFLLSTTCNSAPNSIKKAQVYISGKISKLENSSKISLVIGRKIFIDVTKDIKFDSDGYKLIQQEINNGSFTYQLEDIAEPQYANLSYNKYSAPTYNLDIQFLIEPGDSIMVSESNGNLIFSGRNAEKYNCEYKISQIAKSLQNYPVLLDSTSLLNYFHLSDSLAQASIKILDSYKQKMSSWVYEIEKSKIVASYESQKSRYLTGEDVLNIPENSLKILKEKTKYLSDYENPIWNSQTFEMFNRTKSLINSRLYLQFVLDQYSYDSVLLGGKDFSLLKSIEDFNKNFTGNSRDWIFYMLLTDPRTKRKYRNQIGEATEKVLSYGNIQSTVVEKKLRNLFNLSPGSIAYNFSLPGPNENIVTLEHLKGKILLLDFWYIGCGACIRSKPIIDSISNLFNPADFQIVSICIETRTDRDYKPDWKTALTSGKYSSPTSINLFASSPRSDPAPIVEHYGVTGCPTFILIDKNGHLTEQPSDPRSDNGYTLTNLIKTHNK